MSSSRYEKMISDHKAETAEVKRELATVRAKLHSAEADLQVGPV
jgi:hypothetical protein